MAREEATPVGDSVRRVMERYGAFGRDRAIEQVDGRRDRHTRERQAKRGVLAQKQGRTHAPRPSRRAKAEAPRLTDTVCAAIARLALEEQWIILLIGQQDGLGSIRPGQTRAVKLRQGFHESTRAPAGIGV